MSDNSKKTFEDVTKKSRRTLLIGEVLQTTQPVHVERGGEGLMHSEHNAQPQNPQQAWIPPVVPYMHHYYPYPYPLPPQPQQYLSAHPYCANVSDHVSSQPAASSDQTSSGAGKQNFHSSFQGSVTPAASREAASGAVTYPMYHQFHQPHVQVLSDATTSSGHTAVPSNYTYYPAHGVTMSPALGQHAYNTVMYPSSYHGPAVSNGTNAVSVIQPLYPVQGTDASDAATQTYYQNHLNAALASRNERTTTSDRYSYTNTHGVQYPTATSVQSSYHHRHQSMPVKTCEQTSAVYPAYNDEHGQSNSSAGRISTDDAKNYALYQQGQGQTGTAGSSNSNADVVYPLYDVQGHTMPAASSGFTSGAADHPSHPYIQGQTAPTASGSTSGGTSYPHQTHISGQIKPAASSDSTSGAAIYPKYSNINEQTLTAASTGLASGAVIHPQYLNVHNQTVPAASSGLTSGAAVYPQYSNIHDQSLPAASSGLTSSAADYPSYLYVHGQSQPAAYNNTSGAVTQPSYHSAQRKSSVALINPSYSSSPTNTASRRIAINRTASNRTASSDQTSGIGRSTSTAHNESDIDTTVADTESTGLSRVSSVSFTENLASFGIGNVGSGQRKFLSEDKRIRKNELARMRSAKMKEKIEEIHLKSDDEINVEDVHLYHLYEKRRLRKNERSRELARRKKAKIARIAEKPEAERTEEERRYFHRNMEAKYRKNEGDRLRRLKIKQTSSETPSSGVSIFRCSTASMEGKEQRELLRTRQTVSMSGDPLTPRHSDGLSHTEFDLVKDDLSGRLSPQSLVNRDLSLSEVFRTPHPSHSYPFSPIRNPTVTDNADSCPDKTSFPFAVDDHAQYTESHMSTESRRDME